MTESATDPLLAALMARGSRVRQVTYRHNRTVLLSVSRDGRTLNSHACFREAPPRILDAVVTVTLGRGTGVDRGAALRTLREWEGTRRGLERARRRKPARRRRVDGPETRALRDLYRALNRDHFGGRLPDIPLRMSRRMTRSLGTIRYARPDAGAGNEGVGNTRSVVEIAISADLVRPPNRATLVDTLLHEMAHAEAWLEHAHRGHGAAWKEIARRVGCKPRAVNDVRLDGRGPRRPGGDRNNGARGA